MTNRAYGYHREEIKMRAVFMVASFAVPTIYIWHSVCARIAVPKGQGLARLRPAAIGRACPLQSQSNVACSVRIPAETTAMRLVDVRKNEARDERKCRNRHCHRRALIGRRFSKRRPLRRGDSERAYDSGRKVRPRWFTRPERLICF